MLDNFCENNRTLFTKYLSIALYLISDLAVIMTMDSRNTTALVLYMV